MSRKITCMALAVVMLLAMVLTGCAGTNGGGTTTTTTKAADGTTTTTTKAADGTTTTPAGSGSGYDTGSIVVEPLGIDGEGAKLDWYNYMTVLDVRTQVWEEVFNGYVKEVYNMEVTPHWVEPAEYGAKLLSVVSSGMPVDIMYLSPALGFTKFVSDGVLLPLNDLFEEYMPKTMAKTPEGLLKAVTFDGNIYAVVPFKDLAENNSVIYDKRWLEESGLEMTSWTQIPDLDELLYSLREWRDEAYPDKKDVPISHSYPLWYRVACLETVGPLSTTIMANYEGLEYIAGHEAGVDLFCAYDNPEFLAHVQRLNQMTTDRIYPYDRTNFDKDNIMRNSGEIFAWYSQGYVAAPNGVVDYETSLQMQNVSMMFTGYVQAAVNSISADTQYPESAAKLLEVFNNDKYLGTVLRFGYEGKHWLLTDNGQADCVNAPLSGTDTTTRIKYWYGVQIGDITNCVLPTDVTTSFGDVLKDLNDNAIQSKNLGFSPVTTSIDNELSAVSAVCKEYVDGTNPVLYSGMLTEDESVKLVDEFVAKLKANGVEKIRDEFQTQLDAWRVANG